MIRSIFFLLLLPLVSLSSLYSGQTKPPFDRGYVYANGRLLSKQDVAWMSAHEHFNAGVKAMKKGVWKEAARHFRVVTASFPNSSFADDAYFFLGKSHYHRGRFEEANQALSTYLEKSDSPKHFEATIQYKLYIAESFQKGAKRRLFGSDRMPKILPGTKLSLQIYDEVIAAIPNDDIAAQAFFAKGQYLKQLKKYPEAIDNFQQLVRKFPLHELAPESYLAIVKGYYQQSQSEFQNPDLLPLAEINLKRFQQQFPGEERIEKAEQCVVKIKEVYAQGLYDTAKFYERTRKPKASVLYYHKAVRLFPETTVAKACKKRLHELKRYVRELQLSEDIL